MDEQIKTDIENATVEILGKGGRGVLVSDYKILTAAHCLAYELTGGMALGDFYIEEIKTAQGQVLKVSPYFIDPVSDLAVLGPMDIPELYEETLQYEAFCEKTLPVFLYFISPQPEKSLPVFIFNNDREWVKGNTFWTAGMDIGSRLFEAEKLIQGGASGGPIVTENGELIAIVSFSSEAAGEIKFDVAGARPSRALPVWIFEKIIDAELRDHLTTPYKTIRLRDQ